MTSLEVQHEGSRGSLAAGPWVFLLLLSSAALGSAGPACAANGPLGFYVGAGVGDGNLERTVFGLYGAPPFPSEDFAWKLMFGARVSPWFGGEIEYLNFGSARLGATKYPNAVPLPDEFYGASSHSQAAVAMAVGYLPLSIPWLDVYGKLGVARLWTSLNASGYYPSVSVYGVPVDHVSESQSPSGNGFAYGAGIQSHFGAVGLRLEYERISSDVGTPFMVSLGATWTFR